MRISNVQRVERSEIVIYPRNRHYHPDVLVVLRVLHYPLLQRLALLLHEFEPVNHGFEHEVSVIVEFERCDCNPPSSREVILCLRERIGTLLLS